MYMDTCCKLILLLHKAGMKFVAEKSDFGQTREFANKRMTFSHPSFFLRPFFPLNDINYTYLQISELHFPTQGFFVSSRDEKASLAKPWVGICDLFFPNGDA